ncbi:MAG: thiamine pyrophosphate-requiring protein [Chloroflexi bacterium]|nr:thiamine pyrophosphate-requiring protein [Chloroflexota bacterium]
MTAGIVEANASSTENPRDFDQAAEAFLALLLAHGSRYVFINPGTDTFPLQEAWARRAEQGKPSPTPIMCLHEHTAVSAAHGYFLATNQPQTVVVHVDAGTLNAGGALHNAQRGQAGMLFCAGRAPYTWDGEMPGGKDLPIHWWQEQLDQAGIVRGFVKWHYELSRTENLAGIVERAFAVAANEPAGPVYLTLPREVLMLPASDVRMPGPHASNRATAAAADPEAIAQAATYLARADRPLIVAGRNGRDPQSVAPLERVAELAGARIVYAAEFVSVTGDHPLNLGPNLAAELPKADVVLFVDPDVPYVPNAVRPSADAVLIQIDREPLHEQSVVWNWPMALRITARAATALTSLALALEDAQTASQKQKALDRRHTIQAERKAWLQKVERRARAKAAQAPMDGEWVAWCLKQVLPDEAIVVEDVVTNRGWIQTHLMRNEPGTYFAPGGSSLGWPQNAAIGIKLARPDRPVVAITGDGGFVFGNPLASLWTAQKAGAPALTVVFNNGGYNASKAPIRELYPEGAVVRANDGVVTAIDPTPNYAQIAQACGAFGATVRDPAELESTLRRALDEIQHGRSAVVDAVLKPI